MKKVGIIGGGIVGLCSAYYLREAGHSVTIIDRGDLTDGCSWGNAGMIVPSHLIPLAAPGMVAHGIRWMFNSSSPFYVRPRVDLDLLRWGYTFYNHANTGHVKKSAPILAGISLLSKELHRKLSATLGSTGYHERGLLMLFKTEEALREEESMVELANQHGIKADILDGKGVQLLEPDVRVDVLGGIFFPGDAHVTPQALVAKLILHLQSKGVIVIKNSEVTDFGGDTPESFLVKSASGDFQFDEVVIATGSWSSELCRKIKVRLPLQPGKGYSFTAEPSHAIHIPSILAEERVAVTPFDRAVRFGGTLELGGINSDINMNRVKGITEAIPKYYPDLKVDLPKKENVWSGLRPCSPDGLPYIGRLKQKKNVIIATGHAMMGLSLGPATGKLVAEMVEEKSPSLSLTPFDPERFS
jgi:D-amino-acid dehydrogenase